MVRRRARLKVKAREFQFRFRVVLRMRRKTSPKPKARNHPLEVRVAPWTAIQPELDAYRIIHRLGQGGFGRGLSCSRR